MWQDNTTENQNVCLAVCIHLSHQISTESELSFMLRVHLSMRGTGPVIWQHRKKCKWPNIMHTSLIPNSTKIWLIDFMTYTNLFKILDKVGYVIDQLKETAVV